eukprot:TRINITY_DN1608_c0_g1_i7.p1 TRINITY_DN1608_c0_g1~~TRINITY_DN1608_c0_g1_i7.p1  ORF type:complete len:205 (-),score=0.59 TRINITY_DN1608_c0_g1_i7:13-627(-)
MLARTGVQQTSTSTTLAPPTSVPAVFPSRVAVTPAERARITLASPRLKNIPVTPSISVLQTVLPIEAARSVLGDRAHTRLRELGVQHGVSMRLLQPLSATTRTAIVRTAGSPSSANAAVSVLNEWIHSALLAHAQKSATAAKPTTVCATTQESECVVCLEKEKTVACVPCGHVTTCVECAKHSHRTKICLVCRAPVESFLRIYQ